MSLASNFSKIFEKLRKTRILDHLIRYILTKEQYGLRKQLRKDNAMYNLTDEIINVLNNKLIWGEGGGIFCDLEKSFECVNCGGKFQSIPNLGKKACLPSFTTEVF